MSSHKGTILGMQMRGDGAGHSGRSSGLSVRLPIFPTAGDEPVRARPLSPAPFHHDGDTAPSLPRCPADRLAIAGARPHLDIAIELTGPSSLDKLHDVLWKTSRFHWRCSFTETNSINERNP